MTDAPRLRLLHASLLGFQPDPAGVALVRIGAAKVGSNLPVNAPASVDVTVGVATPITGVSVEDSTRGDILTVDVSDTNGLLNVTGSGVSGSGTTFLEIFGPIGDINAALATLEDNDPVPGSDLIAIEVEGSFAGDGSGAIAVTAACYLRGTRIATPHGEQPIETLAIGDLVLTADGGEEPIRWIGQRAYQTRFARGNPGVHPICIRAGALADGVPVRDLFVSSNHAMVLDGLLVPASELVNGVSILRQAATETIDYIHLELARHDVILAEGAPSESFVDDDSRMLFQNAAEYAEMYPTAQSQPATYCAMRVTSGYALETIRTRLGLRAALMRETLVA
jgi:hypothetical protein